MKLNKLPIFALMILSVLVSSSEVMARVVKSKSGSEILPLDFAYRKPGDSNPNLVGLQASANSRSMVVRACGADGLGCSCEFYSKGNLVYLTKANEISYQTSGNYFYCQYSGSIPFAQIDGVKLKSFDSKTVSELLAIRSSFTLPEVLGGRYFRSKVRNIQEYSCKHNYLQKQGTNLSRFDCSASRATCGSEGGNFCLLQANFSYFLYYDQSVGNVGQKASDKLYGANGSICGLQIFAYSCTGEEGAPRVRLGLYAQKEGVWDLPVSLSSGPDAIPYLYGFAASPFSAFGKLLCPPGLEAQRLFSATSDLSRLHPTHNVPNGKVDYTIAGSESQLSAFQWKQFSGGQCDGVTCSKPNMLSGIIAEASYVPDSQVFCALPAQILGNGATRVSGAH